MSEKLVWQPSCLFGNSRLHAFDAESRKWIVTDRVPQIMESCAELYLFTLVSERIVGLTTTK